MLIFPGIKEVYWLEEDSSRFMKWEEINSSLLGANIKDALNFSKVSIVIQDKDRIIRNEDYFEENLIFEKGRVVKKNNVDERKIIEKFYSIIGYFSKNSGIKFITKGNKLEEELIKSMLNSKNSHFRFEKMNLNENLNILLEIPKIVGVGKNYYFYRMDIPIETYLFRNGKIFNDLVKSYENYSKISLDRAKFI